MKNISKLIIICFFALVFRLALAPYFTHGDLTTQSEWGAWMYQHGPKGLYDWNQWISGYWPNHPPLISLFYLWGHELHSFLMMCFSNLGNFIALNRLAPTKFIWFFNFIQWFGQAHYENSFFLKGVVLSIKLPMIFADIIIAFIIYHLCKINKTKWLKYILVFLFLPFSWYLSTAWGQSDPLAFIFLILAFIFISSKKSWLSPLLFAIAINLKPTGLIFTPLYFWIWYRQRQPIRKLIIGSTVAAVFTYYIISLFASRSPISYFSNEIVTRIFFTIKPLTHVNSFNLWYLINPQKNISANDPFLFFNATIWGYLIYFVISLISFSIVKYKKLDSIFASLFIAGFGGWLFMANMHERYVYAGLVSLLFLSIYKHQYFKYFIILSIIFFINLLFAFHPETFSFIDKYTIFYQILSLANIILYILITKKLISKTKKKYFNG